MYLFIHLINEVLFIYLFLFASIVIIITVIIIIIIIINIAITNVTVIPVVKIITTDVFSILNFVPINNTKGRVGH